MATESAPSYAQIRIWDSTKTMIDWLCQEDKRTIAAELDVVLAQVIESRGTDPLTLQPLPPDPASTAPVPPYGPGAPGTPQYGKGTPTPTGPEPASAQKVQR